MSKLVRGFNRSQAISFGLAVLIALLVPAIAKAELLDYFTSAMPKSSGTLTWSGTETTSTSPANVNIYYAVFGRAAFESVFGSVLPTTGDGGSDAYVYAYQVDNASNSTAIKNFSVGLFSGSSARNQGQLNDPDIPSGESLGTPSTSKSIGTSSAIWYYSGAGKTIPGGGRSMILYFTSPNTPIDGQTCQVMSGASSSGGLVPTPSAVPEPSTIFLLIAGLCLVAFRPIRSMFS